MINQREPTLANLLEFVIDEKGIKSTYGALQLLSDEKPDRITKSDQKENVLLVNVKKTLATDCADMSNNAKTRYVEPPQGSLLTFDCRNVADLQYFA